jgi:hypothetical protein
LQKNGLAALYRLVTGTLPYDDFLTLARPEQATRIEEATAANLVREAEERAREAAKQQRLIELGEKSEAARLARESDPKHLARVAAKNKNRELRSRYGLDVFIDDDCFSRLMNILRIVDSGKRLGQDDFVWLSSVGEEYFSETLRNAYHLLEAEFFAREFRRTQDPWMAVNASSHYRKCKRAGKAAALLDLIDVETQDSSKLKSALCTTGGGVMRDLRRWDDALRLGEEAHAFSPGDYRPCTLLGAVHTETGSFSLGHEWYAKAVERGARPDDIDQDMRSIFYRSEPAKQTEMRDFLLRVDPDRYAWAAHKPGARGRRPQS